MSERFRLYQIMPNGQPPFESVYDNIEGFGRMKSVSYRIYKAERDSTSLHKLVGRQARKRFRRAIKKATA